MAANKKKALGTGLESIFGSNIVDVIDEIQNNAKNEEYGRKLVIDLDEIHVNPYQPRKSFDETKLNELADSIRENGVFTPILVRKDVNGGYQLVAGERRLRASQIAQKTEIPAIVMDFTDEQMMEIALLENVQREDLNVIEEALGYQKIMDNLGYTQEQMAGKIGKSREHVANTLRLLKLPKEVQKMVEDGKLTMGQVRPLISLSSEKATALAKRIVAEGLSARAAEQLASAKDEPKKPTDAKVEDPFLKDLEKRLKEKFTAKVKVSDSAITITYHGNDDLNRILQELGLID